MENKLTISLMDSISEEANKVLMDIIGVGIDSVFNDSLLKDVPMLSTAISLYKIGKSVTERHYIKKLAQFVCSMNAGAFNEERRQYYQSRLKGNPTQRNRELEYIMILISRYINYDKPDMLAKLYLAYLNQYISWQEFTMYAEILDRFLPGDFEFLCKAHRFTTVRDQNTEVLLRLIGLGLVIEEQRKSASKMESSTFIIDPPEVIELRERNYHRTDFGEQLVAILSPCNPTSFSEIN